MGFASISSWCYEMLKSAPEHSEEYCLVTELPVSDLIALKTLATTGRVLGSKKQNRSYSDLSDAELQSLTLGSDLFGLSSKLDYHNIEIGLKPEKPVANGAKVPPLEGRPLHLTIDADYLTSDMSFMKHDVDDQSDDEEFDPGLYITAPQPLKTTKTRESALGKTESISDPGEAEGFHQNGMHPNYPGVEITSCRRKKRPGEKPHNCRFCEKSFSDTTQLNTHELTHTGEKKDKKRRFADPRHPSNMGTTVDEASENQFRCRFCDKRFSYESILNAHENTHTGEKKRLKKKKFADPRHPSNLGKNPEDGICIVYRRDWNARLIAPLTETEKRDFVCVTCGKICADLKDLEEHKKKQGIYHNNQCPRCPEVKFETWPEHQSHQMTVHSGVVLKRCKHCAEGFEDWAALRAHGREKHCDEEGFERAVCTICGQSVSKANMTSHMQRSHMMKQHQCDICEKWFSTGAVLSKHKVMVHVTFPCEICGKIVKNRYKDDHLQAYHTPESEKKFVCPICVPTKGFIKQEFFDDHMNVHNKVKPHICLSCPNVAYASKANLHAHIRATHKGLKRKSK